MRQEISSKTHVAFACCGLFLVALFLTAYSAKNPYIARLGTRAVLKVVAPVLHMADSVGSSFVAVWSGYVNVVHTSHENRELKKRIADLENRVSVSSEVERENIRLREVLNFSAERRLTGVTASVVGGDPSGWVKGIVVDKGSAHGVQLGMAAIHPNGVVGQVVSVSDRAAKILLVSDHASGVDVLMHEGRARGVVEGAGERVCELKFVNKDVQVRVGDTVITSGMDGVYPKGIVVGTVSQIGSSSAGLFQPIEVKPSVDFTRLEEVVLVSSGVPNSNSHSLGATNSSGGGK